MQNVKQVIPTLYEVYASFLLHVVSDFDGNELPNSQRPASTPELRTGARARSLLLAALINVISYL